jgi:hypothetical protein
VRESRKQARIGIEDIEADRCAFSINVEIDGA